MNDEKAKRMKALMDELMNEIADEVVDEQTLELLRKNLRKAIAQAGLKYSVLTAKLFIEGFEFCFAAFGSMGPQGAAPLLIGMRKIIKELGGKVDLSSVEEAMRRTKDRGSETK